MNPEQPRRPDPSTSRVKRCLFGRGNHEENIKFAKRELEKSLAESKARWNFDFEAEVPLDGRFDWKASPYPRPILLKKGGGGQENLQPEITSSRKSLTTSSSSSSDVEQSCDPKLTLSSSTTAKSAESTSGSASTSATLLVASSTTSDSSASSQRTSSPVKMNRKSYFKVILCKYSE